LDEQGLELVPFHPSNAHYLPTGGISTNLLSSNPLRHILMGFVRTIVESAEPLVQGYRSIRVFAVETAMVKVVGVCMGVHRLVFTQYNLDEVA
jgi:hypothetical protein